MASNRPRGPSTRRVGGLKFTIDLPEASDQRLAVHAVPDALKHLRTGHPWLWDGSIERISKAGASGDLAVVFDEKRKFVGIGLFDPFGPISVRMLHAGPPKTIDGAFFADRITDAVARRQPLVDDPTTTAYRLVHGENDRLPGLVVDRYDDVLVVRLDTSAWLPHLRAVVEPVVELTEVGTVVLRTSRRIRNHLPADVHDGMTLIGEAPSGPVRFLEAGLAFDADVVHGQKTGHFLDQRDNRQLVAGRARDAEVLDVFCNTGGFSVHAANGGARSVHSIDLSAHAIAATEHHMQHNRDVHGFTARHTVEVADAFDALEALADRRARFDLVVIDPPSFAPNAASVPAARRAYRRLTALALELVGSGGTLFQASCSSRIDTLEFHDLIADELDAAGWKATNEIRTQHAIDHPIGFPEGAYLKAVLCDVHRR